MIAGDQSHTSSTTRTPEVLPGFGSLYFLKRRGLPQILGTRTAAQNKVAESDLRKLLTSEAVSYANTQTYVSATTLATLDPTYTKEPTVTKTVIVTPSATTATTTYVCLSE